MNGKDNIWNRKSDKLTEDMLQAYFDGKLSAEQQHEVEMWLSETSMEADALEGLQTIPANESREITNKLNRELQQQIRKKPRRRSKAIKDNYWAWIAIVVILILCVLAYSIMKMIK
jgi:anti-sigma factor RsiW